MEIVLEGDGSRILGSQLNFVAYQKFFVLRSGESFWNVLNICVVWKTKKKIFSQVSISHYIFLIFNENQQEKNYFNKGNWLNQLISEKNGSQYSSDTT